MSHGRPQVRIAVAGASLGGLKAFGELLAPLPRDFPIPLVLVQHRHWSSRDAMTELLQARTVLPVSEVHDKHELLPGNVYVAPANYHVLVGRENLCLSLEEPVNHSRPSIDVLFESAAEAYGPAVLAILLTGASEDGARGLARVAQAGGTCLVQDPGEAESPLMPRAAIQRVCGLRVMGVLEIATVLARLSSVAGDTSTPA